MDTLVHKAPDQQTGIDRAAFVGLCLGSFRNHCIRNELENETRATAILAGKLAEQLAHTPLLPGAEEVFIESFLSGMRREILPEVREFAKRIVIDFVAQQ